MSKPKKSSYRGADRRRYPRITITIPVMLKLADGPNVTAVIQNISPRGMLVRLSREAAVLIQPNPGAKETPDPPSVHACFMLPVRFVRAAVAVTCTTAHLSHVSDAAPNANVAVGFRFKRFRDTRSLKRFVRFIEEQMVPPEDFELYLYGPAALRKKKRTPARPRKRKKRAAG